MENQDMKNKRLEQEHRYSRVAPEGWEDGLKWAVDPGPELREASRQFHWAYRGYSQEGAIERIFESSRKAQKELDRLTAELIRKRGGLNRGFY